MAFTQLTILAALVLSVHCTKWGPTDFPEGTQLGLLESNSTGIDKIQWTKYFELLKIPENKTWAIRVLPSEFPENFPFYKARIFFRRPGEPDKEIPKCPLETGVGYLKIKTMLKPNVLTVYYWSKQTKHLEGIRALRVKVSNTGKCLYELRSVQHYVTEISDEYINGFSKTMYEKDWQSIPKYCVIDLPKEKFVEEITIMNI